MAPSNRQAEPHPSGFATARPLEPAEGLENLSVKLRRNARPFVFDADHDGPLIVFKRDSCFPAVLDGIVDQVCQGPAKGHRTAAERHRRSADFHCDRMSGIADVVTDPLQQ